MMYTTVETAVKMAVDLLEANHIMNDTDSIYRRVMTWYEHTDIADPEILAACALTGKDWFPGATYDMMLEAKEEWFPHNPYDEYAIWEIEDAQHDMWR